MTALLSYLKSSTNLPETGIKNVLQLLDEDATIPFIARYRKERTGNLDEVQLGEIVKYKEQFEALEKRKVTILKALEEQEDCRTSKANRKHNRCYCFRRSLSSV